VIGYGSSFMRFLDYTQRRATGGRTPLDEWSARRKDLYKTTHNTRNRQTSMLPVGFEPTTPAGERPQTYALDRAATGTGILLNEMIWPPHCPEKSGTNHPVTPRNIPEERKTQLHWQLRLWHGQEILTKKAESLSGTLMDVALYETRVFRNPKDHHLVSMTSHMQQESKRERSENERWELPTLHVCRHFCTHNRYVKPV
jgi:hypothetical protein